MLFYLAVSRLTETFSPFFCPWTRYGHVAGSFLLGPASTRSRLPGRPFSCSGLFPLSSSFEGFPGTSVYSHVRTVETVSFRLTLLPDVLPDPNLKVELPASSHLIPPVTSHKLRVSVACMRLKFFLHIDSQYVKFLENDTFWYYLNIHSPKNLLNTFAVNYRFRGVSELIRIDITLNKYWKTNRLSVVKSGDATTEIRDSTTGYD